MNLRLRKAAVTFGVLCLGASSLFAGKWGFSDSEMGGKNDPIITVSGSINLNQGAQFSYSEELANSLFAYNSVTGIFSLSTPPPVIPRSASGGNQFIMLKFPMKISKKKVRKTLFKDNPTLAGTSFLTSNITITDQLGVPVPGIATCKGKNAKGQKVSKQPGFPSWIGGNGKNQLVNKKVFAYISDDGDGDINTTCAFVPDPGNLDTSLADELRVRLNAIGGVTVNGFWLLRVGDGTGQPANLGPVLISSFTPKHPVSPPKTSGTGNVVVESFSSFFVEYSEPVVPESVGFSATQVKGFNASNPTIPLLYNGNWNVVPNPNAISVPLYPNFQISGSPNGVATFTVPFDCRPVNPNNLSLFLINPLVDLPSKVDVSLTGIAVTNNNNPTTLPSGAGIPSAATSLYNVQFDDQTAGGSDTFRTSGSRAFVNMPVPPQAIFYGPLTGTGIGVLNLDGNGYETNDPSTERLLILTNQIQIAACPFGSFMLGCNKNTFGDLTAVNPIGIGGNPPELGGPTPVPGVNEGSTGGTASNGNPNAIYPIGFETVGRNSDGDARLVSGPELGSIGDIQVGDFLDKLFFDALNPYAVIPLHTSLSLGGISVIGNFVSNNISDPPVPNPTPDKMAVGLPMVEIVFSQQKLKQPAFVIEGDEVFSNLNCLPPYCTHPYSRTALLPNPFNPIAGDILNTFAQNGPWYQTFPFTSPPLSTACLAAVGCPYSSRQQIGNFLFVTDRDLGVVQVLNSNKMTVISTIETPDPEGLGVSPDLRKLYVSNYGDSSLSVIDVDPYSPTYSLELNRVNVGSGPRDVSVQPENEDVFVCNYIGNSISIFSPTSQTIRNTVSDSLNRPWQIVLTPRHFATGWLSSNYQGYICNQGGMNIPIYESGPSGSTGVGADAIRWFVDLPEDLQGMRYMCYDPGNYPGTATNLPGGVYVTHRESTSGLAMISRIAWTTQTPGAGALPPTALPSSIINSPGAVQRRFEIVGTWGGPLLPFSQQLNPGGADQVPYDVCMADFTPSEFFAQVPGTLPQTNFGAFPAAGTGPNSKSPIRGGFSTWFPDRMYISFPGNNRVDVVDPNNSSQHLNSIEGATQVGILAPYFDQ